MPVANAGIGGYGIDQSFLMLRRQLPRLFPRMAIFSFVSADIDRSALSIYGGAHKPYFLITDGVLKPKNLPVPEYSLTPGHLGRLRYYLGWSFFLDWLMESLGRTEFWRSRTMEFRPSGADGFSVSCRLMEELAHIQASSKIPVVLFPQYTFSDVESAPPHLASLVECGRTHGLHVIDPMLDLRRRHAQAADKKLFGEMYWLLPGDPHHSPAGEELMAEILARELTRLGLLVPP